LQLLTIRCLQVPGPTNVFVEYQYDVPTQHIKSDLNFTSPKAPNGSFVGNYSGPGLSDSLSGTNEIGNYNPFRTAIVFAAEFDCPSPEPTPQQAVVGNNVDPSAAEPTIGASTPAPPPPSNDAKTFGYGLQRIEATVSGVAQNTTYQVVLSNLADPHS